jgi:hypothetical protein
VGVLHADGCSFASSAAVSSISPSAGRPDMGKRVTVAGRLRGIISSLQPRLPAVMGTTLRWLNMPDRRLMCC